ncbi:MAG: tRNA (adenosine(37)-N6)-threonylcarbamoyltransferase complex ATPase subunit type 1 TsaE [Candidatus Zambryskibacteria bacterium]|nr:tRNA (adenosine(37)-N6)-threonylcarbamoyltransferase complex ATPase subunit type 1 TsaE [Candidatus Zambryskibacteria bacterium]
MSKHLSRSLEETQKIAENFVKNLLLSLGAGGEATTSPSESENSKARATVVGLYGELGAGKTTFTQVVSLALGVSEKVLSPTFVIMKIYNIVKVGDISPTFNHLIHIDAYRMDSSDELLHLGWKEIISNPKNLILIEWPEKVADIMPEHIKVNLAHISKDSREIEIVEE